MYDRQRGFRGWLGRLLLGLLGLACFSPSGRAGCRTCRATACSSLSFSFGYPLTAPVQCTSGSADVQLPIAAQIQVSEDTGGEMQRPGTRMPLDLSASFHHLSETTGREMQRRLQTDGRVAAAFLETRWNILEYIGCQARCTSQLRLPFRLPEHRHSQAVCPRLGH